MTVTINGTTGVAGVDGTAATPAIQGNDTNTGIFFPAADTIAFAEGGAEVARFDSSGRLILGSTTADGRLKVVETATGAGVTFYSSNDNSAGQIGTTNESGLSNGININAYRGDGKVVISTNNTERMRLDSSGTFYIGKTSTANDINTQGFFCRPWGKMVSTTLDSAEQNFVASHASASGTVVSVQFFYNGNSVGTITKTASSTAYNTSSDYRLKENITPMQNALNVVQQLKPVTYNWKTDGSSGQGFIAHELQAVVPECVTGEKDAVDVEGNPQYQGIDTSFLVATLTAAIQEQQAIITDLKARIETLENK